MNGRTAKGILFFPWVSHTRTSVVCFPGGIFYIFCFKTLNENLRICGVLVPALRVQSVLEYEKCVEFKNTKCVLKVSWVVVSGVNV